jgi:cytoskeletal protein RodZ
MISLADLRARNVQPVWQEAVAVVQELIQTVSTTSGHLPDLEHIALIPNGDVVALPGSPVPANPVRHVASMLKVLVQGVATPPELEQFLDRNIADPPEISSLADFTRNLAFFERPGRRSDVERLVGRAAAVEQTARADEELKRLMERATEADAAATKDMSAEQERSRPKVPLALVASVVVLGAIVIPAWWWRARVKAPQPPAPAAASTAAPSATGSGPSGQAPGKGATATSAAGAEPAPSFFERTRAAVRSAVEALVSPTVPPAAKPAEPVAGATPEHVKGTQHRKGATTKTPPDVPPTTPSDAAASAPVTPPESIGPVAEDVSAEPEATDETIYSPSDAAVTPPMLVRPVLPKDPPPGVPLNQIGSVEILVDLNGDVEQVRLLSPANRFHERMLVSAAKMWKFRPAFKDGHPVRYRTRVRLTV